jgi:hypothetical protein
MSRWKNSLKHWDRDLRGISEQQLQERLRMAHERERSSEEGMGRNPKAARDWRARRKAVEEELARRREER